MVRVYLLFITSVMTLTALKLESYNMSSIKEDPEIGDSPTSTVAQLASEAQVLRKDARRAALKERS